MNTPDSPKQSTFKSAFDKRLGLALCIGIICSSTLTDVILHLQPWWLHQIVLVGTTLVVTFLVLWIIGRFGRA